MTQEYDEYFKRAKMLTGIHAPRNDKRSGALSNTTNVMGGGPGGGEAGGSGGAGGDPGGSPNPKKAKPADPKAVERKRSLKRL